MSHQHPVGVRECKSDIYSAYGESRIYYCPKDDYCCNNGCCTISPPGFQFYQLWYYWFMVLFMFLLCSGGQWWYRYVVQGRCASVIAPPPRRTSYPRQCRVAYTAARDTVVLQHLWKPSYSGLSVIHGPPPPSYSQSGASCSSGGSGPKLSPYMQLYGPPPTYESVFGSGPVPVHQHSNPGEIQPSFGGDQQTIQLSLDQRQLSVSPPAHHRRATTAGELKATQLQSATAGASGQIVPLGLGGPSLGHMKQCSSSRHQHHIQKASVESNREGSQDPQHCSTTSSQISRPNQVAQERTRSQSPQGVPSPSRSKPDTDQTRVVVPTSAFKCSYSSPDSNTSLHSI